MINPILKYSLRFRIKGSRTLCNRILCNRTLCNRILFVCILAAAIVAVLITTACGGNTLKPVSQVKTGPTQTVDIKVPIPLGQVNGVELNLEFLAGEMKLAPGANGYLASGVATFNAVDFAPKVEYASTTYTVKQGNTNTSGFLKCPDDVENRWDLQIADIPISLNIKAGAYEGSFELGGLSLENLAITEKGSNFTGSFSEPNHVEMSSFTYSTGGSHTELTGLANANFKQMVLKSAAGDYLLSFDGKLQSDASVMIDAGMGVVNINVPPGVNAQATFEGSLSSVKTDGGWTQNQNGNVYTLSGSGPTITITVKMKAGALNLKSE